MHVALDGNRRDDPAAVPACELLELARRHVRAVGPLAAIARHDLHPRAPADALPVQERPSGRRPRASDSRRASKSASTSRRALAKTTSKPSRACSLVHVAADEPPRRPALLRSQRRSPRRSPPRRTRSGPAPSARAARRTHPSPQPMSRKVAAAGSPFSRRSTSSRRRNDRYGATSSGCSSCASVSSSICAATSELFQLSR